MKTFKSYLLESKKITSTKWNDIKDKTEKGEELHENIGGYDITIKKMNSKWTKYTLSDFDFSIAHKPYEGENDLLIKDSATRSQTKIIYNILSTIKEVDNDFNPTTGVSVRAPRLISALKSAGFKPLRKEDGYFIFGI